jgi:hypothetical protein
MLSALGHGGQAIEQGATMPKKSDYLRNQETPTVLGYELDRKTLVPIRCKLPTYAGKDYGADPIGDGMFRMVPSGDVVDYAERNRRLTPRP